MLREIFLDPQIAEAMSLAARVVQTLTGVALVGLLWMMMRAREHDRREHLRRERRMAARIDKLLARLDRSTTVDEHADQAMGVIGFVPPWRYARPELAKLAQQARRDTMNTITQILPPTGGDAA